MTSQAIGGYLALSMRFMTLGAIRNLTVNLVAEGTRLLGMGTCKVGKILSRAFVTGKTRLLDITGQMQGKGCMRIGMA